VIAQAKAELKLAELHLDACSVRSPIDGVIIDRRINVGQTAPTKVALFLIASDPAKYQVWANVEEISIAQIAKGQTARFTVDTLPKKQFTGRVSQIRFNAQVVNNAVRYTVVIDVDDAKGLVPYQTADVFINTEPSK
jgi:HlyD family secretion protein